MAWRNSQSTYGRLSRLLHWSMAALIIGLIGLGLKIANMPPALATLWLYGLHKSLGILALALGLARLAWHHSTPPPDLIGTGTERRIAKITHLALYAAMIAMPLSGWVGASASGLDVLIFDAIALPKIAPNNAGLEEAAFALHWAAARLLIALVALHAAAALWHAALRDGILARMLGKD